MPNSKRQTWPVLVPAAFLAIFVTCVALAAAPVAPELLWPKGAPGAKGDAEADKPKLTVYRAPGEQRSKTAIVVCPGGGYGGLAMDHEGVQIAAWLNSLGVTAAILDYRHRGKGYGHPAPLQDAQRAIRTLRARASELEIDPHQIGILGFSAGGHLASSAGTHFDAGKPDDADPIERVSCRPDFLILCYPVITLVGPVTHQGSKRNLLGPDPDPELVKSLSSELQVTADTPPTFLFHTSEDTGVPSENSILFYLALQRNKVPCELHIFEKGRHGIGLGKTIPGSSDWSNRCAAWLAVHGWIEEP